MHQTLFDFADEERQLISPQSFDSVFFEVFDVANRVRVGDSRAARYRCQIRVAGSGRGIAYAAAAVNAVVENIDQ